MAIEQAQYTVVEKKGPFELRRYDSYITAGTLVDGDFTDVGNIAFRRLFDYSSGANQKKESIAMTAPVTQEPFQGKWWICFVMPSKYTLETLPQPLDPQVEIKTVPARLMASITYSGSWSQKRYHAKELELSQWIKNQGWIPLGDPLFARYDPPFQLWFLRRNEILFSVNTSRH